MVTAAAVVLLSWGVFAGLRHLRTRQGMGQVRAVVGWAAWLALARALVFWTALGLYHQADGRQALGYLLLVTNTLVESAAAHSWRSNDVLWRLLVSALLVPTSLCAVTLWRLARSGPRP